MLASYPLTNSHTGRQAIALPDGLQSRGPPYSAFDVTEPFPLFFARHWRAHHHFEEIDFAVEQFGIEAAIPSAQDFGMRQQLGGEF